MSDVVGQIPEFTTDEPVETGSEGVIKDTNEQFVEETETPTEHPAEPTEETQEEEKPADNGEDTEQPEIPEDVLNKAVAKATEGLRGEIVDLRNKLAQATGNDRKLIQQQITQAEGKIDELKDVNPEDISLIEKVLQSKGYMTKEEVERREYESVKNQVLNNFLEKYPEYKPENDPDDMNWKALTGELSLYAAPKDPRKYADILERARQGTGKVVSDPSIPAKKRAIQVASAGGGGTQRSSSNGKTLSPQERLQYEQGGWSEEEINQIEKNLPNN